MKNTTAGWIEHIRSHSGTAKDRRNQRVFATWAMAWAVAFLVVTWILRSTDSPGGAVRWLLALSPNLLGIGTVLAYLKFLRNADELMQRTQLMGLAFGFGIGVVFAMGYQLAERAGAPDLATGDLAAVMFISWAVGQVFAVWRYR